MYAEIITIGDEILIGQIVDTNSAWMAQKLNEAGIRIKQMTSVADNAEEIKKTLDSAKGRADIILITGGLGPTKDDITKKTLCAYFNTSLLFDEKAYENVKQLFAAYGLKDVREINKSQAEVPEICTVLYNPKGTASGMWFDADGKVFVSMPGVPHEMKYMMEHEVIPRLKKQFWMPHIYHKTILTQGVGESFLAEMIADWEDNLPVHIKLAYLPAAGMVRLRLSGVGEDQEILHKEVDEEVKKLEALIAPHIYGYDDESLELLAGKLLKEKGKTIATAESCTGGYIAHLITSIAGSSAYFLGSMVTYSNASKTSCLGVKKETLEMHGAVSEQTVLEMAKGVREKLNSDYAISCSGIAGPDGGTADKPVGTVWIAIATPEKIFAEKFQFGNNRERNIQRTAFTALNKIIKELKSA